MPPVPVPGPTSPATKPHDSPRLQLPVVSQDDLMVLTHFQFFCLQERCPSPNSLAKAKPDLLRIKARQRKWTHNKGAISASSAVCLPRRLTVMAATMDSRTSPQIIQCPVAPPNSWLLLRRNHFWTVCSSLDLQASQQAKQSLKLFTEQNIGCSKGSAFQCLLGYCWLQSHCTDWHVLFFPQSHLIRASLASQEAFSYLFRSQTD